MSYSTDGVPIQNHTTRGFHISQSLIPEWLNHASFKLPGAVMILYGGNARYGSGSALMRQSLKGCHYLFSSVTIFMSIMISNLHNQMAPLSPSTRTVTLDAEPAQAIPSDPNGYRYTGTFYLYIESGSLRSAKVVVPLVLRALSPVSVLDVGCGAGAWLSEYKNHGITDYLGVDGDYVPASSLLIPADHFESQDVMLKFDLGRRFSIVQCLEVGEHLQTDFSRALVQNLTMHGDMILFSAATPGQGGENHINEQTHQFWRMLFAEHGYKPFDLFRPMIKGNRSVESWYRHNIVLYIAETAIPKLPLTVLYSGIPDGQAIPDLVSLVHKIQARVLSLLPNWCVSKLALTKHHIVIACRRLSGR